MSGGTANLGLLSVGQSGTSGTMLVSGTAQVNASTVVVARQGGVNGVLNMTGGQISTGQLFRGNSGGTAAVNLSGGVLQATANNPAFIAKFNAGEFNLNGAAIDTQAFNVGVTSPLGGSGGIIKNGTGTLTIASTGSTYTGSTIINAGTLRLQGAVLSQFPTSAVQAFYPFESSDPVQILKDASPNHNDLQLNDDQNGNAVGTAAPSHQRPAGRDSHGIDRVVRKRGPDHGQHFAAGRSAHREQRLHAGRMDVRLDRRHRRSGHYRVRVLRPHQRVQRPPHPHQHWHHPGQRHLQLLVQQRHRRR